MPLIIHNRWFAFLWIFITKGVAPGYYYFSPSGFEAKNKSRRACPARGGKLNNWGMHLKHIKIINKLGVYEYPEKSNGI